VGVGYFSGLLRTQLQSFSGELIARDKRIGLLQKLNQLIVENIPTGILTLDTQGAVIQSNPAALKILEWVDFSEEPGIEHLLPGVPLEDWLKHGPPRRPVEFQIKHPHEGDVRTLKVSMTPIWGADEEELGFLLSVEDLTAVKQLEQSMRQSEKLAAVGQLAAGIAHEIRNPLASISGSVQMLATMLESISKDGERLTKITLREIDRLNNMITEFLDFVKPEKSELKQMDLAELTREVAQMVKVDPSFSQRVEISVDVSDALPILGDRDKLKQALLNIMINACQAMDKVEYPLLAVRSGANSEVAWVEIQDNGIGMDEKTQKRIFEPFLTTKPKGTGLGLSVTHRIIENHYGRILVQSQVNEGSTFRLEFPVAHGDHQKLRA
jgi:two-component system sensor histidine kinase PilS (NtrC family)